MSEITRPRQLAALMIEEFIGGGQIQINPEDYPKEIQGTAIAHARNVATMIVYTARRAANDPDIYRGLRKRAAGKPGSPRRDMAAKVLRYMHSRRKSA